LRDCTPHGADRTIKDENYDSDPAGWAERTGSLKTLKLLRGGALITSAL
jgi:hypothetical protein